MKQYIKDFIKEEWPLAFVTLVILSIGIALFEGGLL